MNKNELSTLGFALVLFTSFILPVLGQGENEKSVDLNPQLNSSENHELNSQGTGQQTAEENNQLSSKSSTDMGDTGNPKSQLATKSDSGNQAGTEAPAPVKNSDKTVKFIEHLPHRLGFFTAGTLLGTPINFVRKSMVYTASDTKELVGDKKSPFFVIPAGTLSAYFGVASGLVEAPIFTAINSWKHSGDEHLSKASLGL